MQPMKIIRNTRKKHPIVVPVQSRFSPNVERNITPLVAPAATAATPKQPMRHPLPRIAFDHLSEL
jgi:hypothetical protein